MHLRRQPGDDSRADGLGHRPDLGRQILHIDAALGVGRRNHDRRAARRSRVRPTSHRTTGRPSLRRRHRRPPPSRAPRAATLRRPRCEIDGWEMTSVLIRRPPRSSSPPLSSPRTIEEAASRSLRARFPLNRERGSRAKRDERPQAGIARRRFGPDRLFSPARLRRRSRSLRDLSRKCQPAAIANAAPPAIWGRGETLSHPAARDWAFRILGVVDAERDERVQRGDARAARRLLRARQF